MCANWILKMFKISFLHILWWQIFIIITGPRKSWVKHFMRFWNLRNLLDLFHKVFVCLFVCWLLLLIFAERSSVVLIFKSNKGRHVIHVSKCISSWQILDNLFHDFVCIYRDGLLDYCPQLSFHVDQIFVSHSVPWRWSCDSNIIN